MTEGLSLHQVTKSYGQNPLFGPLDATFTGPGIIGIVGPNGAGKSSFLKMCAGYTAPTTGSISWTWKGQTHSDRQWAQSNSMLTGPYVEPILELTAQEQLDFHFSLRPPRQTDWIKEALHWSGLETHVNRPLRYFSSGMLQKMKLILALVSEAHFVFLDEPTANLDQAGVYFFHQLLLHTAPERLIFIASNHQNSDLQYCTQWYVPAMGKFQTPEPQ
jgi:ABC-type multidrug transport system ATPase subunit